MGVMDNIKRSQLITQYLWLERNSKQFGFSIFSLSLKGYKKIHISTIFIQFYFRGISFITNDFWCSKNVIVL